MSPPPPTTPPSPLKARLSSTLSTLRQDIHPLTLLLLGLVLLHSLPNILFSPATRVHHLIVDLLPVAASLYLVYRAALVALVTLGWVENPYLKGVFFGPASARLGYGGGGEGEEGGEEGGNGKGVVCFIVGLSVNHPAGSLAPGASKMAGFWDMNWADAEENREKWGFLGKSPPLIGRSDTGGTHIITLSYWKTLDDLANFSRGPIHLQGLQHIRSSKGKYPHLGLMHETYVVPKGLWENLYLNSHPIGFGQIKYRTKSAEGEDSFVSSLYKTTGGGIAFKKLRNMVASLDS